MKLLSFQKPSKFKVATVFLVFALVASSTYFYVQYKNEQASNPAREVQETTAAVSKFMELPQNEEPSLATVTEKEKLQDQEFFKQAENGDKVLIYIDAGKAILYRPSTGKIIDVTSINTNPTATTLTPENPKEVVEKPIETPVIEKKLTITLLNGSETTGITKAIEDKIVSSLENFTVVSRQSAEKTTYQETLIVDITGGNKEATESLQATIGGEIGALPKGEILPDSDILVIVGTNPEQ